ncbi:MAG: DUF1624 domain-containing protein [Deltaproteobacteria bacterium]|nr:DUF1624 domain-containing protein [Deltaproteobacteria bacterium]
MSWLPALHFIILTMAFAVSLKESNHRYLFLDILRGIAVLWMIPTHVLGILLNTQASENPYYQIFLPTTGYVAVAFIFCAGSAVWFSLERKGEFYRKLSPELLNHLRRTAFILLTAYWFNISTSSWDQLKDTPLAWNRLLAFNVLQVIGFSILLSLLLIQILKSSRILKWVFLGIGLSVYAAAPWVWGMDLSRETIFIKSIFGRPPDTAFPFFPWVGHFFMGAAITGFFAQLKNKIYGMGALLLVSTLAPYLIFYIHDLRFRYPGWQESWWFCNPGNSFLRLSKVTCLFSLLYLLEPLLRKMKSRIGFLTIFSKESLQVYVFHMAIVYGRPFLKGLNSFYAHQLSLAQGLAVTLGLTAFSFCIAWIWHCLKERKPLWAKGILIAYSCIFLTHFFL